MHDSEVKAALRDFHALALTLWGEARGEPIEGKVFVGSVIRNRVNKPGRFGNTYRAVCLARLQFSCWWKAGGGANYDRVMARARATVGDYADRSVLPRDPSFEECCFVAEGIIGGQLLDRSKGADHYMTSALFRSTPPEWAKGKTPIVTVGAHVGFKL